MSVDPPRWISAAVRMRHSALDIEGHGEVLDPNAATQAVGVAARFEDNRLECRAYLWICGCFVARARSY